MRIKEAEQVLGTAIPLLQREDRMPRGGTFRLHIIPRSLATKDSLTDEPLSGPPNL